MLKSYKKSLVGGVLLTVLAVIVFTSNKAKAETEVKSIDSVLTLEHNVTNTVSKMGAEFSVDEHSFLHLGLNTDSRMELGYGRVYSWKAFHADLYTEAGRQEINQFSFYDGQFKGRAGVDVFGLATVYGVGKVTITNTDEINTKNEYGVDLELPVTRYFDVNYSYFHIDNGKVNEYNADTRLANEHTFKLAYADTTLFTPWVEFNHYKSVGGTSDNAVTIGLNINL